MAAPGFKVSAANVAKAQIQWAEWDASAMTAGGFLLASDYAPAYLGVYPANTFPNPASSSVAGVTLNTLTVYAETNTQTRTLIPGTLGNVQFWGYWPGPFKDTTYHTLEYGIAGWTYETYLNAYDDANTALNDATYKANVATWNAGVTSN